jgi:hypothetical protein
MTLKSFECTQQGIRKKSIKKQLLVAIERATGRRVAINGKLIRNTGAETLN